MPDSDLTGDRTVAEVDDELKAHVERRHALREERERIKRQPWSSWDERAQQLTAMDQRIEARTQAIDWLVDQRIEAQIRAMRCPNTPLELLMEEGKA